MNDRQLNKFAMYGAVRHILMDNKSIWENRPYFVSNVQAFLAIIEAIRKANKKKLASRKGSKIMKQNSRNELELSATLVVDIMRSYASIIKNKSLEEQIHYPVGKLKTYGGKVLIVDTDVIHSIATEHFEAAKDYGLKQEFLDDLKEKNADFLSKINSPADAYLLRKEGTTELKKLFIEGDKLLKENIDRDLTVFKTSHELFCGAYVICRKIIDSPVIKIAMRIKIVDAVTKEAIPKALVVIKDHAIKRKSSPKGALRIQHLKEGEHTVNVTMKGYITQAVQATRIAGETAIVMVEMVREGLEI